MLTAINTAMYAATCARRQIQDYDFLKKCLHTCMFVNLTYVYMLNLYNV